MKNNTKYIIVTGAAGFIGFHLSLNLLKQGCNIIGIDFIDDYYSVELKLDRLKILQKYPNYEHVKMNINNPELIEVIGKRKIFSIIHLAAQAGVRYSIDHPDKYFEANIKGSYNIINIAKICSVDHLMLASTSSVYGVNENLPFDECQKTDHQISFYAATKKSMETISHSMSHTFDIPTTVFRFFTVYGPWGRPDMALYKFAKAIKASRPIDIYNYGEMRRDFTYIDDLIQAIDKLIYLPPEKGNAVSKFDSLSPVAPWRVVNIGNSKPVSLMEYIECLEKNLGCVAIKNFMPMQSGDVKATYAQNQLLNSLIQFTPSTDIEFGVRKFSEWFLEHNKYY